MQASARPARIDPRGGSMRESFRHRARASLGVLAVALITGTPQVQTQAQAPAAAAASAAAPASSAKAPTHAKSVKRLLIKNGMVIRGTGVPAYGPVDLLVEDGLIARVGTDPNKRWPAPDATIDATGKYVMPGIVNTHMHWNEE